MTVMVGSRVPSGAHTEPEGSAPTAYEAPLPTVKDRHMIAVKWRAHDDNDDTLSYDVYYRGDGETHWKLLRCDVEERLRQSRVRHVSRRRLHDSRGRVRLRRRTPPMKL